MPSDAERRRIESLGNEIGLAAISYCENGKTSKLNQLLKKYKKKHPRKVRKLVGCLLLIFPHLRYERGQDNVSHIKRSDPVFDKDMLDIFTEMGEVKFFSKYEQEIRERSPALSVKIPLARSGSVRSIKLQKSREGAPEILGKNKLKIKQKASTQTFDSYKTAPNPSEVRDVSVQKESYRSKQEIDIDVKMLIRMGDYNLILEAWNSRFDSNLTRMDGAQLLAELRYLGGIDLVKLSVERLADSELLDGLLDDIGTKTQEEAASLNLDSQTLSASSTDTSTVTTTRHNRNPAVSEWVLNQSDGVCESCGKIAPFCKDDGSPFLEVHHLKRLADGGSDTVSNTVAICPNCHRELHYGADRAIKTKEIISRRERLIDEPD